MILARLVKHYNPELHHYGESTKNKLVIGVCYKVVDIVYGEKTFFELEGFKYMKFPANCFVITSHEDCPEFENPLYD